MTILNSIRSLNKVTYISLLCVDAVRLGFDVYLFKGDNNHLDKDSFLIGISTEMGDCCYVFDNKYLKYFDSINVIQDYPKWNSNPFFIDELHNYIMCGVGE